MKKRIVWIIVLFISSITLIQCKPKKAINEEEIAKTQTKSYTIESIKTSTRLVNAKESIYELQYSCLIFNTDLQDSKIITVTPILKSEFKPYTIDEKPLKIDVNQFIRHNERITVQGKLTFQAKKVPEETQKTWAPYIMGIKILNEKTVLTEKEKEP